MCPFAGRGVGGPDHLAVKLLDPLRLLAARLGVGFGAVVDVCERELLVPVGLRSLSRYAADYNGRYQGDQRQRDAAYHQGTVWPWLMGVFVQAHNAVYGDAHAACAYLEPFKLHLACKSLADVFLKVA